VSKERPLTAGRRLCTRSCSAQHSAQHSEAKHEKRNKDTDNPLVTVKPN
jgi:hypothetical protein